MKIGDTQRKRIREVGNGLILYHVLNAGGQEYSIIEDETGYELYSSERKGEPGLLRTVEKYGNWVRA